VHYNKEVAFQILGQETDGVMDLCLLSCGFCWWMWKLHGLMVEQGSPKSDVSLGGAWEVWRVGVVRPTPFVGDGWRLKAYS